MSGTEHWHPAALSGGLEPGRSAGTRLFDREFCIWRDTGGVAHAWEDRCPHRGMRLSFGFVRGDRIACLYHGWQYDEKGQCRLIPAHPTLDVPPTICVTTFPCVERLGVLWIYPHHMVEAPPDLPVAERDVSPVRSLYIDCAPAAVLRALTAHAQDIGPPGVPLLSFASVADQPIAAVQPFGAAKTALHIVVPGALRTQRPGARRQTAEWAEELRHDLEQTLSPGELPSTVCGNSTWPS
ncbi:MAG TPA: Rieske (2Fe-2S) protein [Xanthobacteraceae bacterium]|nr:Rieske (2Fe-2S) protein [Xanthobacteraceae bacterium]